MGQAEATWKCSMEAILDGGKVRYLAKALQYLGRIGNELTCEATKDKLEFRILGNSNTAFGKVVIDVHDFFSQYKFDEVALQSQQNELSQGTFFLCCWKFLTEDFEKFMKLFFRHI